VITSSDQDLYPCSARQPRRLKGRALERALLLGGDDVVEAAHQLSAAVREIDWQATGRVVGTLEEWREQHRIVFREINEFHELARVDLGVQGGALPGAQHPRSPLEIIQGAFVCHFQDLV
jgi:hypothetical protein